MLEGEARVFAEVFQGDQVAVSKGMAFPHVDIDAAFQDWVEFQIELMEKFLQDFVVEVVQVKDADLAFEIFYVGDDVVGAGFVDSEFVFVHSELLHHFHEGIYCEGVVLHGNTEFLLGMFFGNVFGFDQFVLLYHLAGVAQEFLSLWGDGNSTVGPAKSSTPISSSSSRIAEDKLGCDIKRFRAASFMELEFATVIA